MSELVIASNKADAQAAEAIEQHHAAMAGTLRLRTEELLDAATRRDLGVEDARQALVDWYQTELLPHAHAEEEAIYPTGRQTTEGRLLIEGMLAEHQVIVRLAREVESASDPVRAAAAAVGLNAVFDSHLAKENDLLVPLLVASPTVSLAHLLEGKQELLGHVEDESAQGACGGYTCTCGEVDDVGYPQLDARSIPHAIRHATIFGALESVRPGGGLVLIAPHEPLPLLAQIQDRWPGVFSVGYLERSPEFCRLAFTRRA